jgi:hypothetical protein
MKFILKVIGKKAIKFYEKALAIDKEFKNKKVSQPVIIILVLFILIWVSMRKALEYHNMSLAIDKDLKDRKVKSRC